MLSIGLDIGGANTKVSVVSFDENLPPDALCQSIRVESLDVHYLPLWERLPEFKDFLVSILSRFSRVPHLTTFTMTAELADCFATKAEGVKEIISIVGSIEPLARVFLNDGRIIEPSCELVDPDRVAAANWVAPALVIGGILKNAIFLDAGSTTTDIIPVVDGLPLVEDRSDMGRLANNNLVYTGALRTNVATIVDHVMLDGKKIGIASEIFSTTADINLVLGLIGPDEYTVPTSDGQPAGVPEALRRLSRVVCSDRDHLSTDQILEIADYLHRAQVSRIAQNLRELLDCRFDMKRPPCIVAGIGFSCLAEPAARSAGFNEIITFHDLLKTRLAIRHGGKEIQVSTAAPAISLSLLRAMRFPDCG
jgi:probable H4MPT-linked C1 transfer pathway protein